MHFSYRVLLFLTLSVALQVVDLTDDAFKDCQTCIGNGGRWAVYKHHDFHLRQCVRPVRFYLDRWKIIDIMPRKNCIGLDGDDLYQFHFEFPATWPKRCKHCINNQERPGLIWWIGRAGRVRACLPEKFATGMSKDPRGGGQAYSRCKNVLDKKQRKQRLLKYQPLELETCDKCRKNKFPWCVIEAHETITSFCTRVGPDEQWCPKGKTSTDCLLVPENARNKNVESLAETCDECLTPGNKLNSVWCVASFFGRKIKYCILREQSDALCPGAVYDKCSSMSSTDKVASVKTLKDAKAEAEAVAT